MVGLLGVLKGGRTLTAPMSVDGAWQLQGDLSQFATLPCGSPVSPENAVLNISQSGKSFELDLPNGFESRTSGVVDGTKLTAALSPIGQSHEAGCGKDRMLSVIASLDPKATPRSLEGTISVDGCPSCPPVKFQAIRQSPAMKKGAH